MARAGSGRNEDALSEIVGFVLVLALVVVASTLYLMYVVPAEGREDEIEHMNQVQDRFVSYKTSVDGLWMRSLADLSTSGTRGVSLSTSFDLGTGGGNTQSSGLFLSFMKPIGTAARMRLTSQFGDIDTLRISVDDGTDAVEGFDPPVNLGQLSYETDNYYWIQQRYEYSAGGVFLEQVGEGVSIKVAPPLSIYKVNIDPNDPTKFEAKMNLCLVNPTGEDALTGGTGPMRVETRLRENVDDGIRNQQHDSIHVQVTARNKAWGDVWERIFLNAALQSGIVQSGEDITESGHAWFEISRSGAFDKVVDFTINDPDDDTDATVKDLYLDLTRANLQVTFEYVDS